MMRSCSFLTTTEFRSMGMWPASESHIPHGWARWRLPRAQARKKRQPQSDLCYGLGGWGRGIERLDGSKRKVESTYLNRLTEGSLRVVTEVKCRSER